MTLCLSISDAKITPDPCLSKNKAECKCSKVLGMGDDCKSDQSSGVCPKTETCSNKTSGKACGDSNCKCRKLLDKGENCKHDFSTGVCPDTHDCLNKKTGKSCKN